MPAIYKQTDPHAAEIEVPANVRAEVEKLIPEIQAIGDAKCGKGLKKASVKIAKQRASLIIQIGELTGRQIRAGSSAASKNWNDTIFWLDSNYPGWRGYEVNYPGGRVG